MTMTVAAGTAVTWTNEDDVPHTVVSDDTKTFKSKALDTGEHFSYTFAKPGKYHYFCSVHPKMMAEIVVQ
jgi:plastocyanin